MKRFIVDEDDSLVLGGRSLDRPLAVLCKIKGVLMEDSAVFEEVLESLEVILKNIHHVMKHKSRGGGR